VFFFLGCNLFFGKTSNWARVLNGAGTKGPPPSA
jgi:hypothetical protein